MPLLHVLDIFGHLHPGVHALLCFEAPLIVTEFAGNRAWAPKTLPVLRWQARQWQTEPRTGSAEVIAESLPQEQEGVRTGIDGFPCGVAANSDGPMWPKSKPEAILPMPTPP
jgi:hypothetical protein